MVALCASLVFAGTASAQDKAGVDAAGAAQLKDQPDYWTVLTAQLGSIPVEPAQPDPDGVFEAPVELSLRQSVLVALKNNPTVLAESLTPLSEQSRILEATAQFDPLFNSEVSLARQAVPTANQLQAGFEDAQTRITNINGIWNFGLSKQLRSGAGLEMAFTNERFDSNQFFLNLRPQYTPNLQLSLNQPLLRGFGFEFTGLRIRIAETSTQASVERYKAAVADFALRIIQTYWAVVGLEERLDVLKGSLELSEKTVRDNKTRVDVGVLPPVAVLESQAEEARRREDVIVAANELDQAKRRLRQLVYMPGQNPFFPRAVNPGDRPVIEQVDVDAPTALKTALEMRPEIKAAGLAIGVSDLNVALNENGLLPTLNLFGGAGLNSLAGTNDDLQADPPFQGDYGDSLNRLFDGRFYSYQAGIRLEIPIGNAQAKAQATRARVEKQQAYDRYRETISEVGLQVGQAVGDVKSDFERIKTTRVGRELSEQNLRNQTKRYEVGMVTTTDLIKFQNDLAAAKLAEIQAVIEYSISLRELDRARGTLLSRYDVEFDAPEVGERPWWSKF